ncbi:RagB/SusD family nutrient uptake outer membrane protein [Pedobacter sp. SYSU D00535]|uniref:RagB/SusD family nutrient uptake outer membrane protein n=1 Tax=Pedobacter sp. SYSU D00535 TaxID=2810308 RepID=UPI001A95B545|nr:RagB/SusD family nutrient uptake outer membrane protein [Pedobacter sp. SYSU D00535]
MKKLQYFLVALVVILAGCDKKLDLANPNYPTTATYWKTADHAFAGINGVYNALALEGTYTRSFPGLTDSRGDDFYGASPWADLVLVGRFTIPSNSAPVEWIWRDHFLVVYRANQVIANVGKMDEGVLSAEAKNRIVGQAYFLRALAYYNLVTTFKAVPLITEPPADQNNYYPPTASEEALWTQIFEDLKDAEELLPLDYANVTGPDRGQKGRATKGAAAGLLGRAYLYRKLYPLAAQQFEKFLLPGGVLYNKYSLMPNYRDNFKSVNENNAESLFEIQFTAEGGTDGNWTGEPNANWRQFEAFSVTYAPPGETWGGFKDYQPTRWIYNEFKQEKTITGQSDPRLLATITSYEPADNSTTVYGRPWPYASTNELYTRKYTYDGLGLHQKEAFETGGINYRILRFADILLMYAEVLNELDRTAEAYPFIQAVRNRANLPNLATTKPSMNKVQMREQIAHERALEFAIEGQRINDIIRWGWLYDPAKLAELRQHDSDFNSWQPGKEYLPIPFQELNTNKNLSPNSAN